MLKSIIFAAAGLCIAAATPATAGPGVVLQGKYLNGIKLQGVSADVAGHRASLDAPRTPLTTVPAVDVDLPGRPVSLGSGQAKPNGLRLNGAKLNGVVLNGLRSNGLTLNGITWNGIVLNGITWNGITFNGLVLNGIVYNGKFLNGTETGTPETAEPEATFSVRAVTMAGGERVVIR